jgi:hypothetical protein
MNVKRLFARLAFSLVFAAAMAPWARGQGWVPNFHGLDVYSYNSPSSYYPPLYVVPPWPYVAPDWYYYQPYASYGYPPFYGGYYAPNNYQGWYYYWYNQPRYRPGWHGYYRYWNPRAGRANPYAPTEVPRSR